MTLPPAAQGLGPGSQLPGLVGPLRTQAQASLSGWQTSALPWAARWAAAWRRETGFTVRPYAVLGAPGPFPTIARSILEGIGLPSLATEVSLRRAHVPLVSWQR